MFFPFLDYVKVPFSASNTNTTNILTLSYKAYVTVEVASYSITTAAIGKIQATNPTTLVLRHTDQGTSASLPLSGGGVFRAGQTFQTSQIIISGTLHVFRLPENI